VASSTKLTKQEMLALNYTASDVAASLASGASPFTILLQQGGQVKDAFGGVGNLVTKLAAQLTPLNVGLGLVAAAFAAVGAGALAGSKEQKAYDDAVLLTGNYAALTNDRLAEMSAQVAKHASSTKTAAREILVALAETGRVGPDELDAVSTAALRLATVSGKSKDDVVAQFASMRDGVARWAEEADKAYHFLSSAQMANIKELEEQGKTSEAMRVTSQALYEHLGGPGVQNLGLLQRAWRSVGNEISDAWDKLKAFGREETYAEKVARLQAGIAANQSIASQARENAKGAGMFGSDGNERAAKAAEDRAEAMRVELLGTQRAKLEAQAAANRQAAVQGMEDRAKAADKAIDKLRDETKGQSLLNKELEKYKRQVADLAAVGRAPSQAQQDADIAALRKKFNPAAVAQAAAQQNAVQARMQALGDERAALGQQIAQFDKYGRAVENTARAVLDYDLAHGKLKGTAAGAAAELRKMADSVDAEKLQLAQLKESERIDKRVEKLRAAADAQALSNREARVAQEIAAIDEKILVKGSALYNAKAAAVRAAVNAEEDQLLVQRLRASSKVVDDDVARLREETALIGKNTLERNIATYALKLEAEARKELLNSPGKEDLIEADRADKLKRYTEAAKQAYDAQRDAAVGMRNVVARYVEDSGNMAAVTERLFERTTNSIEDSLTELLTTGHTSIKQLVNTLLAEFNRLLIVRPLMASLIGGGGGGGVGGLGLLGALAQGVGSVFAGSLGTSGTAALANLGGGDSLDNFLAMNNNFAGARAAGGPVEAGARYLVGENGPEPFVPRVPGTILPNSALRAGGGQGVVIHQTVNVGAGANRAEVVAAARAAKNEAVNEISRMIRNGSL